MALIPLTYKLDWYNPAQPGGNISTVNNNANTATSYDTQYTMQDIIDTVIAGGATPGINDRIPVYQETSPGQFTLAPSAASITYPSVPGANYLILRDAYSMVLSRQAGSAGGDPEFVIVDENFDYKVSMGWDDDGGGYGYLYNWAGDGWRIGASGNNPMLEVITTVGSESVNLHKQVEFVDYGSGTYTGVPTYNLEVDASGNVIETTGSLTTYSSTIDYQTGNPINTDKRYWIVVHLENKTVGSPDFGSTYTGPQDWYFKRQSSAAGTQGGMPFNLFYNQYTPALDPGYDAGGGCGATATCLRVMMEESVADINVLNSGADQLGTAFTIMTTDMAALSSYRAPLTMNIDGNGASPGNGTLGIRIIYGNNTSPSSDDDTCLPSTVSVYFRDTTDTSSKVGGPQFNLVWAGADTVFAQTQNGGAAYTAGTDFVFSGNPGLSVTRRYELLFQDEVNAYNRCSYLKVTDGRVVFEDLPTVDPVSKGVLWNDAGDLKISLG